MKQWLNTWRHSAICCVPTPKNITQRSGGAIKLLVGCQVNTAHRTKFETDQKNRLDELAKKRKAEKDEQIDAAKNHKAVAEASAQLVQTFQKFSTPPAQPENVGAMVEQKLATMKTEIMQEIGVKMEESSKEVKDTLASILGLLQNKK